MNPVSKFEKALNLVHQDERKLLLPYIRDELERATSESFHPAIMVYVVELAVAYTELEEEVA